MKLFLAIIYVFFPVVLHLALKKSHNIDLNIPDLHVYVSEAGICLVILYRLFRKTCSGNAWLLLIAFVSVLTADIVYTFTIGTPSREWLPVVYLGESGYTVFVSMLLAYLIIKLKPLIKDRISMTVAFVAAAIFAYLSFIYILIPYYHAEPVPPLFHIANSTLYTLIQAAILGIIIPPIFRSDNQYEHIFMQSLLLLCVADFALRYHSGFESGTPVTWHAYVWDISMAVFFVTILKSDFMFSERDYIKSYISVRTFLTIAISVGILFFLGLLYSIGLLNVGDAFKLTNLLLVIFLIWFISNFISLKLSRQVLMIAQMLFRPGQQFEIENMSKSSHLKFRCVDKLSRIFEIDEILHHYNQLACKSNDLLDALAEKNKLAAIGQTTAMVAHDVRKPFSVVKSVLDMGKGMTGLEVVKQIRKSNIPCRVYVVANEPASIFENKAKDAGADGYYNAPLDKWTLESTIQG